MCLLSSGSRVRILPGAPDFMASDLGLVPLPCQMLSLSCGAPRGRVRQPHWQACAVSCRRSARAGAQRLWVGFPLLIAGLALPGGRGMAHVRVAGAGPPDPRDTGAVASHCGHAGIVPRSPRTSLDDYRRWRLSGQGSVPRARPACPVICQRPTLTWPERHPVNPVKAQVKPETICRIARNFGLVPSGRCHFAP